MPALEIERKFIIKLPEAELLKSFAEYTESEIEQIYLNPRPPFNSRRVRRRAYRLGRVLYFETAKRRISKLSAEESEREISEVEYRELILDIEEGTRPIVKTRKTFTYMGKVFEIDIYPEWKRTCIMEVELSSESESFAMPPEIEIIREVSGIGEYSNHAMAKRFPKECE